MGGLVKVKMKCFFCLLHEGRLIQLLSNLIRFGEREICVIKSVNQGSFRSSPAPTAESIIFSKPSPSFAVEVFKNESGASFETFHCAVKRKINIRKCIHPRSNRQQQQIMIPSTDNKPDV